MSAAGTKLEPSLVNVRVKISALWASMLFVFAYVDLFSLYRSDFRRALESGTVSGFTIGQAFLVASLGRRHDDNTSAAEVGAPSPTPAPIAGWPSSMRCLTVLTIINRAPFG